MLLPWWWDILLEESQINQYLVETLFSLIELMKASSNMDLFYEKNLSIFELWSGQRYS